MQDELHDMAFVLCLHDMTFALYMQDELCDTIFVLCKMNCTTWLLKYARWIPRHDFCIASAISLSKPNNLRNHSTSCCVVPISISLHNKPQTVCLSSLCGAEWCQNANCKQQNGVRMRQDILCSTFDCELRCLEWILSSTDREDRASKACYCKRVIDVLSHPLHHAIVINAGRSL